MSNIETSSNECPWFSSPSIQLETTFLLQLIPIRSLFYFQEDRTFVFYEYLVLHIYPVSISSLFLCFEISPFLHFLASEATQKGRQTAGRTRNFATLGWKAWWKHVRFFGKCLCSLQGKSWRTLTISLKVTQIGFSRLLFHIMLISLFKNLLSKLIPKTVSHGRIYGSLEDSEES